MTRREMLTKRLAGNRQILDSLQVEFARLRESQAWFEKAIAEDGAALGSAEGPITPADLRYAATSRCPCGAGLAYVKDGDARGSWDCSAILLGTADQNVKHTALLPFTFYEVKSEDQPSAGGATTRP